MMEDDAAMKSRAQSLGDNSMLSNSEGNVAVYPYPRGFEA